MQNMEEIIRDNKWLKDRLIELQNQYFSDIEVKNKIAIKFGKPCKTRLGSIKPGKNLKNEFSFITINGHFQDLEIPEFVIDAVIAHEFMHYGHGFASPLKKAFRHPHKGGVVDWDLKKRGLAETLKLEKQWLKKNWKEYLINHGGIKPRVKRKKSRILFKWI